MGSLQQKISRAILKRIRARRESGSASETGLQPQSNDAVAPARLREASFSDFSGVAALKQRWGLAADSIENWDRLWRRNPALEGTGIQHPIGWVLEADQVIVGYLGNILLECCYGEKNLTAVAAHAFVVDTPYRALSVSLAAAFFRQKSVDLCFSTSSIESVGKIALAFKSAALPQPDYDTILFWVLRPYPFAQALAWKLHLNPSLSWIGAILGAFAVGADTSFRSRWPKSSPRRFTVCESSPEEIGDDLLELWSKKLKERPRLLASRDSATMRWHFAIPGDRGETRMLRCYQDGDLLGYAIVRSDTDPENGLKKSLIADILATEDDPAVVRSLLGAAFDSAKRSGSHILEVQGFPSAVRHVLSECNPYQRKLPACPYYYKANDPTLHKALMDSEAWYACPYDGDSTLIRPSFSSPTPNVIPQVQMQLEDARASIAPAVPGVERAQVL